MSEKKDVTALSNDLKKAVLYGKRIMSAIELLPKNMGKKQWPAQVLDQVMDEALKKE